MNKPIVNVRERIPLAACLAGLVVLLIALNAREHRVVGTYDMANPDADGWAGDVRRERGWPSTFYRTFDNPSALNAGGRLDLLWFLFDVWIWSLMGGAIVGVLNLHGARRRRTHESAGSIVHKRDS